MKKSKPGDRKFTMRQIGRAWNAPLGPKGLCGIEKIDSWSVDVTASWLRGALENQRKPRKNPNQKVK